MRFFPSLAIAASVLATPALAETDYAAAIKADYARDLGAMWEDFHRTPELSFREFQTAAKMATALRKIPGMVVTEKVGGTGVVGVLKNGSGPTVLLRADMDGLPIEERSGLPVMSKARQMDVTGIEEPVMHACGHDTHITGMIATARRLAAMKDRWSGTVLFVVQPAEERLGGAIAMVKDGLYTRFPKPDYALAWHVDSSREAGTVSAAEGTQYSSGDAVDIVIKGVGAHGASPQAGKDPVYMGSQLVIALQGLISRERPPLAPGVITVGSFHSGTKHNIISEEARLQITIRANDETERAAFIAGVKRIARAIGELNGLAEDKMPTVTVVESTPVTANDPALARRLNAAIATALGAERVTPYEQKGMGSEDFAYFITPDTGVKGYYFSVGGTEKSLLDAAEAGGTPVASHHSPLFKVAAEPAIVTGATAMTAAVLDLLKPGAR